MEVTLQSALWNTCYLVISILVSCSADKKIHTHYRKREYSSRVNLYSTVCIMTYFSSTEYNYTSILAECPVFAGWSLSNEIVMLSFQANQKEAAPLKMYVFHETSLFELNLIQ